MKHLHYKYNFLTLHRHYAKKMLNIKAQYQSDIVKKLDAMYGLLQQVYKIKKEMYDL